MNVLDVVFLAGEVWKMMEVETAAGHADLMECEEEIFFSTPEKPKEKEERTNEGQSSKSHTRKVCIQFVFQKSC